MNKIYCLQGAQKVMGVILRFHNFLAHPVGKMLASSWLPAAMGTRLQFHGHLSFFRAMGCGMFIFGGQNRSWSINAFHKGRCQQELKHGTENYSAVPVKTSILLASWVHTFSWAWISMEQPDQRAMGVIFLLGRADSLGSSVFQGQISIHSSSRLVA